MLKLKSVEEFVTEGKENLLFERYGYITPDTDGTFQHLLQLRTKTDKVFADSVKRYTAKADKIRETLYNSATGMLVTVEKLGELKKKLITTEFI